MYSYKLILVDEDGESVIYDPTFNNKHAKNISVIGLVLVLDRFREIDSKKRDFDTNLQALLPKKIQKKQGLLKRLMRIFIKN